MRAQKRKTISYVCAFAKSLWCTSKQAVLNNCTLLVKHQMVTSAIEKRNVEKERASWKYMKTSRNNMSTQRQDRNSNRSANIWLTHYECKMQVCHPLERKATDVSDGKDTHLETAELYSKRVLHRIYTRNIHTRMYENAGWCNQLNLMSTIAFSSKLWNRTKYSVQCSRRCCIWR